MDIRDYLEHQRRLVDQTLDAVVPPETQSPETIHKAMRYSLFAGGKRLRPILCMEAARAVGRHVEGVERAACSLELIHTYSLIHDDLPALDNDDLRRGRPTNHKVFGEAIAILAGDSLLTLAFLVLAQLPGVSAETRVRLVAELASASGTVEGMIAGQVRDLEGERETATPERLEAIHRAKTGSLLRASVRMGAIYAGATVEELEAVTRYGEHIGLAFQIIDDVLDLEQPSEQLGKTAGKDVEQNKITFPAVYGLEESRRMAHNELLRSQQALAIFGQRGARLRELAEFIVHRKA
ncbi:MAG: polyprenyl synthetase family protein [Bryobacteraceae bacterium]|nr:polyprenyl synthetase family protein [Bryobacteraceae bacterium]MDW8380100.1 polyprenyl synthetase family protein [Bryobacterales bacterium]